MFNLKIQETTAELCDWCGRDAKNHLIQVTIVTPRGAYREDICTSCRKAYDDSAE